MAESKANKVRAKLIEMYSRLITFDDKADIYINGDDNQYPMEMERVVANSPTGKRAAGMLSKYIAGAGVTDDKVVNKKANLKKSDIVKQVADDVSVQYGCWVHVGYAVGEGGKLVPVNPKVLDYNKCRKSKEDSEDNEGKIYYDEYEKGKTVKRARGSKKTETKWYYPFNKDQGVVISQIKADAKKLKNKSVELADMLPNYRGQVYYLNLTPKFVYAVSLFDAVFDDCDTEYRMSLYSNNVTRTGFLGKVAVITQGLDEADEKQVDADVQAWLGAEESGNIWRLNVAETEDIAKVLRIEQLESQYDEKQFTETRENCRINILGAANNIPKSLVMDSETLFAQSGAGYVQYKIFYNEMTEHERNKVESTMALLGFPCTIIPLVDENAAKTEAATPDQLAFRKSNAGVKNLIRLQSSVFSKGTSIEAATALVVRLYGYSKETAAILMGTPDNTPTP